MPLLLLCTACGSNKWRETPAVAYQRWQDRIVVRTHLPIFGYRPVCSTKWINDQYGGYWDGLPIDQCLKFNPPERMQGLWRRDFEGSQFCPAPARACSFTETGRPFVWLDTTKPGTLGNRHKGFGGLYAVEFIGRRTSYEGAYGHLGGFDQEVLVDRMISIKELEPPQPNF
jgi:hypothetical protein